MKKSITAKSKTKKSAPLKTKSKPARLLSGGNPQISKDDGDGPVQSYIEAMPEWKRDIGIELDALITKEIPKLIKAVKWNSPFYGTETCGWLLSFHCFNRYVKVTFFNGGKLDPKPPGLSKQAAVRYLDIYQDDAIDEKQFIKWLKQASKLQGWHAGM
jgi:hypothetical protein